MRFLASALIVLLCVTTVWACTDQSDIQGTGLSYSHILMTGGDTLQATVDVMMDPDPCYSFYKLRTILQRNGLPEKDQSHTFFWYGDGPGPGAKQFVTTKFGAQHDNADLYAYSYLYGYDSDEEEWVLLDYQAAGPLAHPPLP